MRLTVRAVRDLVQGLRLPWRKEPTTWLCEHVKLDYGPSRGTGFLLNPLPGARDARHPCRASLALFKRSAPTRTLGRVGQQSAPTDPGRSFRHRTCFLHSPKGTPPPTAPLHFSRIAVPLSTKESAGRPKEVSLPNEESLSFRASRHFPEPAVHLRQCLPGRLGECAFEYHLFSLPNDI